VHGDTNVHGDTYVHGDPHVHGDSGVHGNRSWHWGLRERVRLAVGPGASDRRAVGGTGQRHDSA
jgi:hypothetical protein